MRRGNFIVDDDVDEILLIRQKMLKSRSLSTHFGLTIAPTSNCNFRCIYCYEKGIKPKTMTEKTQQDIINFVEKAAPNLINLSITWYGGEPLLALDIIEKLTAQFLSFAQKYSFQYNASIITNGYLLTARNAKRLVECKINSCQVTLDGKREAHNVRRRHMYGQGTYDTIISNLKESCEVLPYIALRVNVDKENMDALYDVQNEITTQGIKNVLVYPGHTLNENGCYNTEVCLNKEDYFRLEYNFIKSLHNKDYMLEKYPKLQGNVCGADSTNSYVINADGEVYKCWSDIGKTEVSLGNIGEDFIQSSNGMLYIKKDPFEDEKCSTCSHLPICLGGCPFQSLNGQDSCHYFKYLHELYLTDIAKIIDGRKHTPQLQKTT